MNQTTNAEAFHALHRGPDILVLPNAWDAASAAVMEDAGAKAVATSSAAVAWAHGYPDGDRLPLPKVLSTIEAVRWNEPKGGFFLTLDVPFLADDELLLESARQDGVLWVPMRYFYLGSGGERQLRLSFSGLEPGEIDAGVDRLAGLVRRKCGVASAGALASGSR